MKKQKKITIKPKELRISASARKPRSTGRITRRHSEKILSKEIPYDKDFYKWTKSQAEFLRKKDFSNLDLDNLIEEIESLGKSDKRALHSHLRILLMHLLKQQYQPEKSTPSWKTSIRNARDDIALIVEDSPSLKRLLPMLVSKAYKQARLNASYETGLPESTFPEESPWTIDEII